LIKTKNGGRLVPQKSPAKLGKKSHDALRELTLDHRRGRAHTYDKEKGKLASSKDRKRKQGKKGETHRATCARKDNLNH